jgi:hypothetical protein
MCVGWSIVVPDAELVFIQAGLTALQTYPEVSDAPFVDERVASACP